MKPAFMTITPVNINGLKTNRLMVVLKSSGCNYAKKTGGCTVCGYKNRAQEGITEEQLLNQLKYALRNCPTKIGQIDLLTLGSFFDNKEFSPTSREKLLNFLTTIKGIKKILLESRAEYITNQKLKSVRKLFPNKVILEIGIGLESSNDFIRNKVIKKGLQRKTFEKLLPVLKNNNFSLLTYLLIKPPQLTEQLAVQDAIKSAKYVFALAKKQKLNTRIAFQPVFIPSHTDLEIAYLQNQYQTINLWSVIDIIKQVHHLGQIFVGLSDEGLSDARTPHSCEKCTPRLLKAIMAFNKNQNIKPLTHLSCACLKKYQTDLKQELI